MPISQFSILVFIYSFLILSTNVTAQSGFSVTISEFATLSASDEFNWYQHYSTARRYVSNTSQVEFQFTRRKIQYGVGAMHLAHAVSFQISEIEPGFDAFRQENTVWRSFSPFISTAWVLNHSKKRKIRFAPYLALGMHFNIAIDGGSNFYVPYNFQTQTNGDKKSTLEYSLGQTTSAYERTVFAVLGFRFTRPLHKRYTLIGSFLFMMDSDVHAVGFLEYSIKLNYTNRQEIGEALLQTDGKRIHLGVGVQYRFYE
jgi:hypothetical protein